MIYADNAATTQLDKGALEAMTPFLLNEYGNVSQPYSFARGPKKAIKEARCLIAGCLGAMPEEIYFTSGGTESDNWAIKGNIVYGDLRATITSSIEHHAILNSCAAIERLGFPVVYLPVDSTGTVQPDTLRKYINNKTKLVSVMMANNEVGTIQPIKELCQIAHNHGAVFHTDAVQAVGHMPIDVKTLDVDMLSASAHKFNGPKGIGFLYIKKGTEIYSHLSGGAQESGYRAGTENVAGIVGMAKAFQKNCSEMDSNTRKIRELESQLLFRLTEAGLDYIRNGNNNRLPGNISLSIHNAEGEMLLHRLDLMGITISTGSACDGKNTQISHVLKAMHIPLDYATGTIRISLGHENTEKDVEKIATALVRVLSK